MTRLNSLVLIDYEELDEIIAYNEVARIVEDSPE
jgi:hypothetical protein